MESDLVVWLFLLKQVVVETSDGGFAAVIAEAKQPQINKILGPAQRRAAAASNVSGQALRDKRMVAAALRFIKFGAT